VVAEDSPVLPVNLPRASHDFFNVQGIFRRRCTYCLHLCHFCSIPNLILLKHFQNAFPT
jgi:hypothetical protein